MIQLFSSDFFKSRTIQAALVASIFTIVGVFISHFLKINNEIETSEIKEPVLEIYGFLGDSGGADPETKPNIYSLWGRTLPYTSDVILTDSLDDVFYNSLESLHINILPDEDRGEGFWRHTLLPGILVFVVQNISGENSAKAIIRGIKINAKLKEGYRQLGLTENVVVVHNHFPSAGVRTPSTRGKVILNLSDKSHFVKIPPPNPKRYSLFRYELSPGEEGLYAIELDVTKVGVYDLNLEIGIIYHFTLREKTIVRRIIFERAIVTKAVKPMVRNVRLVFLDLEEPRLDLISAGKDVRKEDLWDYGGDDFGW